MLRSRGRRRGVDADLEAIARRAPRAWRSENALKRAGFVTVEGGLPGALAAARLRRLARQMKRLRLQAGLTQADVARRMGTTPSAISRMESSDPGNLTLDTVGRFARAIGANLRLSLHAVRQTG